VPLNDARVVACVDFNDCLFMNAPTVSSPWLTYEGLARYTGYSRGSLHVMQHEGRLPRSYGKGKARRFHVTDVDAWMRSDARETRKRAGTSTQKSKRTQVPSPDDGVETYRIGGREVLGE
jgi:excisionase family DNA binding protein